MPSKEYFFLIFIHFFHRKHVYGDCNLITHFECGEICLLKKFVCDTYVHCQYGEDEHNCDKTSKTTSLVSSLLTHTTVSYPATTSKSPSATTTQLTETTYKTTTNPCQPTSAYTHKMAIVHDNGSTLATSTGGNVNISLPIIGCDVGGVYSCKALYGKPEYLQYKNCISNKLILRVNDILNKEESAISVEKGSRLDIHCSLTHAPLNESGPTVISEPLQCDATEKCWVTGSEMRVAVQVLNCSSCEQNSCQVKGHRSCLHLVKNETSFQDAKTQCAQLGGVVAGPSVYMDQDGCIQNQLAGVTSLFSSDISAACLVYSTKDKTSGDCKDVTKLPFGCLVPVQEMGTSSASLPSEMIAIIVGSVFSIACLCVFCIVYREVRVYREKAHHNGGKSTYDDIALANRDTPPIYSTIDEQSSDVYSTGCCHCVRTKPASNGKNLTRAGGPPAPHLPPRIHSSKGDGKHVQLQDRMKFDTDSSVALQSSQHALNVHQRRSKTSKRPLQKVVLARTADRQSFICDAEGYLQASHLHTECISTQDGGLDEVSPCCQRYEDPSTDYITPVECEYTDPSNDYITPTDRDYNVL